MPMAWSCTASLTSVGTAIALGTSGAVSHAEAPPPCVEVIVGGVAGRRVVPTVVASHPVAGALPPAVFSRWT
jgi:hypothetical protein